MSPGVTEVKKHEGESAILECAVVADPAPVIVWKKDEISLSDNSRMTVLQNGSLQISSVEV